MKPFIDIFKQNSFISNVNHILVSDHSLFILQSVTSISSIKYDYHGNCWKQTSWWGKNMYVHNVKCNGGWNLI